MMERRGFLRMLGMGTAAAALATTFATTAQAAPAALADEALNDATAAAPEDGEFAQYGGRRRYWRRRYWRRRSWRARGAMRRRASRYTDTR